MGQVWMVLSDTLRMIGSGLEITALGDGWLFCSDSFEQKFQCNLKIKKLGLIIGGVMTSSLAMMGICEKVNSPFGLVDTGFDC